MRREALPQLGLGIVVVLAVVAGFLTVGGPEAGKQERRDQLRRQDLGKLSQYIHCVAAANDNTLPETISSHDTCERDIRFIDPYTGAPYVYERISDTSYLLCATFEAPEKLSFFQALNPKTGCAQYTYRSGRN